LRAHIDYLTERKLIRQRQAEKEKSREIAEKVKEKEAPFMKRQIVM
jgi:hypothetical protein